MIAAKVKSLVNWQRLAKRIDRATYTSLRHAGGSVRLYIRYSIKQRKSDIASPPGRPPYTHTGMLRRSILYDVVRGEYAVRIGPKERIIGPIGRLHEFGGVRFGRRYPARPFVRPALAWAKPRLARLFGRSMRLVGE